MRQPSLRFGISDGHGRRDATWKLWTETARGESDVYLTCRALGGSLKVSMHHSGQWHHAYSEGTFRERVNGVIAEQRDRFVDRWQRPAPIAPGVTLAIRILTPSLSVRTPREPIKSEMVWLPNAPEGGATEIVILYTAPTTPVSDWPGRRAMNTSLVGSIPLSSGEMVWAVYRVVDLPTPMGRR